MSAKSAYLQEEVGVLACFGKSFQKHDDDCIECNVQGDCESLTQLRKERRGVKVAKKPKEKVRVKVSTYEQVPWHHSSNDSEDDEEDETEGEQEEETPHRTIWPCYPPYPPVPAKGKKGEQAALQAYYASLYGTQYPYQPPVPIAPFYPPGYHQTSYPVPHPEPHMGYIQANPIDCPMPFGHEPWWVRVLKNVLSGTLSEVGRQLYEFFRRYRFR